MTYLPFQHGGDPNSPSPRWESEFTLQPSARLSMFPLQQNDKFGRISEFPAQIQVTFQDLTRLDLSARESALLICPCSLFPGMADERDDSRSRRMDLNLYLGLPRSPLRRGTDLGSDLALGSYLLSRREVPTPTVMGSLEGMSDAHDPYSPTHASYSPNPLSAEPAPEENPQFERARCSSRPPAPPSDDRLVGSSRAVFEYSPYLPSEASNSALEETGTVVESLVESGNNGVHHVPYSPSYHPMTADALENTETSVEDSNADDLLHYIPYSPGYTPPAQSMDPAETEEPLNGINGDSHPPYTPTYADLGPTAQVGDDNPNDQSTDPLVDFGVSYGPSVQINELLTQDGSSRRNRLQNPEFRLQRLIEASRRRPIRRFRSTVPYVVDPITATSLSPTQLIEELMASERSAETSMSHKVNSMNLAKGDVDEDTRDQGNAAANFECNICLEMAKEPVVTSCGHLFCWPCLYQWLHLYCDHRECPVCKGQVQESNITPIYGRGISVNQVDDNNDGTENEDSSPKIPPRPHGHRHEPARHLARQRPLSRWLGDIRNIFSEEPQNRGRLEGFERMNLQEIIDDGSRRIFSRLRAIQRLRRERILEHQSGVGGGGLSTDLIDGALNSNGGIIRADGSHRPPSSSSLLHNAIDIWHRSTQYDPSVRFTAPTAGFSSGSERTAIGGRQPGPSASLIPPYPEPLGGGDLPGPAMAAEASGSSTMAVIQGDVGAVDAYAEPEASGVGTSRSMRRRRNRSSAALDVDDAHPARKRQRLN